METRNNEFPNLSDTSRILFNPRSVYNPGFPPDSVKNNLNMNKNPFAGAGYVLQGLKLLFRPGLKRYLIIPVLINILVFSLVGWLGYSQFAQFLDRFLPSSSWLHYFRWLLWPLVALSFLLIVFYTFTAIANLLAAPFNGMLAEKVEYSLTGKSPPNPYPSITAAVLPALFSEFRKLLYFLLRALPLLLLFLIPGLQIAAPFLWLAFSAWYLSLEYMDYPMGNHGLGFKDQLRQLKKSRLTALGFGAGVTLLMMIPILNFAAMPAAVAGATALWCRQRETAATQQ